MINLILHIGEHAQKIEDELHDYLLPSPKGYYLRYSTVPVMVPDKKYFQYIDDKFVEIKDVKEICSTVYDASEEVVFQYPPHGKLAIYSRPIVPTIGLAVVKEFCDATIDSNLRWLAKRMPLHERLRKYFRQDTEIRTFIVNDNRNGEEIDRVVDHSTANQAARMGYAVDVLKDDPVLHYCEDTIRAILFHIREELARFIGEDYWHIYSTKIKNNDLICNKMGDFRIHQWTRWQNDLKNKEVYVRQLSENGDYRFAPYDFDGV